MATQKTTPTEQSVESFLAKVESETVRDDCNTLIKLMTKITKSGAQNVGTIDYRLREVPL